MQDNMERTGSLLDDNNALVSSYTEKERLETFEKSSNSAELKIKQSELVIGKQKELMEEYETPPKVEKRDGIITLIITSLKRLKQILLYILLNIFANSGAKALRKNCLLQIHVLASSINWNSSSDQSVVRGYPCSTDGRILLSDELSFSCPMLS